MKAFFPKRPLYRFLILVGFSVSFAGALGAWWMAPSEWERSVARDPAAVSGGLPPSLKTLSLEFEVVKEDFLSDAVVATARLALPLLISRLNLSADLKKRLNERLSSSRFNDRIVPFLLNSISLYEPSGPRVPKSFHDVMTPKLSRFGKTPGLGHALFSVTPYPEMKEEKPSGTSTLRAKKALAETVLRLYDALYLQTGANVGDGVPKLTKAQLVTVEENFADILKTLLSSNKNNKEVADAIQGILNDQEKQQTIALGVARFVFEIIERHYQVYIVPIRREQALRRWASKRLDAFIDEKDAELFKYLDWEANRKHYGVHIVVDGLQGHLLEALTGHNPTFLKKVAEEYSDRSKFRPVGEGFRTLDLTQNTYLDWIAADPRRVADPNYLPFFKKLYRDSRNSIARNGVSTTPTISVRNLPVAMTGTDVLGVKHGTGVPNFHYVDRKGVDREDKLPRAYYFFGNDAILLADITRRAGMKTMFERMTAMGLDSISCFTPYDRGATVSFDGFLNLSIGEKVRDFGEIACLSELFERSRVEVELQKVRKRLLFLMHGYQKVIGIDVVERAKRYLIRSNMRDALEQYVLLSQKGMPAYLQYYIPWPDHFAHFQGPFSDAVISPTGEYNRLDHWLTLLQRTYNEAGIQARTQFGMAGDHGLSPVYTVLNPEKEVFERYEKETGVEMKILKISSDEGEGPKVSHPDRPPAVKGYDLIIASTAGGNYMIDAFLDQGANWTKQPRYSELKKLRTIGGKTVDLIEMITSRLPSTLDYLVVRDSDCGVEACDLSLLAMRGRETIRDRVYRKGNRIFYRPTGDLLEVRTLSPYRVIDAAERRVHADLIEKCVERAELKSPDSWCTEAEWTKLAESTVRPDSVPQIAHIYDSEKGGTINLFPRPGVGFNSKVPGRHAGEHFHEKDAFVGFWGGGTTRAQRIGTAINGSIAPTLMEWINPKAAAVPDEFGFPVVD